MAKLISGLNGPISGKAGSIIGSSRNGRFYLKGPYKRRTKRVSETELLNRQRFALAQAWLKPLLPVLREGFRHERGSVGGFISAKSYLWHNAMVYTTNGWQVLPEMMKISVGELPPAEGAAVAFANNGQLRFSWDADAEPLANPRDQALLLAYDTQNGKAFMSTYGQFRKTGEDFLDIDLTPGHHYHCYLGFTAADRSACAESVYLGVVEV